MSQYFSANQATWFKQKYFRFHYLSSSDCCLNVFPKRTQWSIIFHYFECLQTVKPILFQQGWRLS